MGQRQLRPNGELCIENKHKGTHYVVGPPGGPVAMIYRNGVHLLQLAETPVSAELLAHLVDLVCG